MTDLKKKVETLINRIAEENNAYVIDVSVYAQGNRNFVKAIVQTLTGITLDEIAALTRAVNNAEDLDNLFPDGYNLEISSPGIDAKLIEYRDFPRNVGRQIQIYHKSTMMKSPFSGQLTEANVDYLVLDVNGERKKLPLSDLDYAKVVIKW